MKTIGLTFEEPQKKAAPKRTKKTAEPKDESPKVEKVQED